MSKKRLERGLVLETEHSFIGKSPTNTSSGKAQWTLPKDKRFGWQVSSTSKVISYSDEYAESSFMKKKSTSSTTFGVSPRVWFQPKKNPGPCDYNIKSTFKRSRSTMSIPPPESSQKFRSMSMYKSDSKIRPGPGDYKTDNYQDLACQKRSPVQSFRKAPLHSIFGQVNPRQPRPDMGSYTPKQKIRPSYIIRTPTNQSEASLKFFKIRNFLSSQVGPQSYEVIPNIQKRNHNSSTFNKALRRFMFNNVIEAVDKTHRGSFNSIKNKITDTSGVTESDVRASRINALQRQVSIFEKRKIFLTGVKGQEYPGPGDYRAPSDFGHYVSEKVVKERQVSSASDKIR